MHFSVFLPEIGKFLPLDVFCTLATRFSDPFSTLF